MLLDVKPGDILSRRGWSGTCFPEQVKRVTKRGIITLSDGERFDKYGYPLEQDARNIRLLAQPEQNSAIKETPAEPLVWHDVDCDAIVASLNAKHRTDQRSPYRSSRDH